MSRREVVISGVRRPLSRFTGLPESEAVPLGMASRESPIIVSGGGTFLHDTFSGEAAGTDLTAHTGEIGATWIRDPLTPLQNFLISSGGRIYNPTAGNNTWYFVSPARMESADYELSGTFRWMTTGDDVEAYFSLRWDSGTDDTYIGGWSGAAIGWSIYYWDGAVFTLLNAGGGAEPGAGTNVGVRFSVTGTSLRLYVNGAQIASAVHAGIGVRGRVGVNSFVPALAATGDAAGIHIADILGTNL